MSNSRERDIDNPWEQWNLALTRAIKLCEMKIMFTDNEEIKTILKQLIEVFENEKIHYSKRQP